VTEEQKNARIKQILAAMLIDPNVVMLTRDRYELQLLVYGEIRRP
jgi:hypothetical protein